MVSCGTVSHCDPSSPSWQSDIELMRVQGESVNLYTVTMLLRRQRGNRKGVAKKAMKKDGGHTWNFR